MTRVKIDGVDQQPVEAASDVSVDRLRTIVQDCHLNFLIGAGTSSSYFARLGNIEEALTELASSAVSDETKTYVRASLQGYFFEYVLLPNLKLVEGDEECRALLTSYADFLRTVNRVLLKRRSTLLGKQSNIFTTNVDVAFEMALELTGLDYIDGFSGRVRPRFDLGEFNTLRIRQGVRYEHRSEIPVFNVYKLHGSASWLQIRAKGQRPSIYFDHGLTLVRAVAEKHAAAKADLLPITSPDEVDATALVAAAGRLAPSDAVRAFAAEYARLGIVNPDKAKFSTTVLNETYYELIRRFANNLEKENTALFVHGFSFRDEHLRDLVVRAARTNPTLLVVVFCYSRSSRDEYRMIMPDSDVKNGNILYIIPEEPKPGDKEAKLTLDLVNQDYFARIAMDKAAPFDQRIELDIRTGTADVG